MTCPLFFAWVRKVICAQESRERAKEQGSCCFVFRGLKSVMTLSRLLKHDMFRMLCVCLSYPHEQHGGQYTRSQGACSFVSWTCYAYNIIGYFPSPHLHFSTGTSTIVWMSHSTIKTSRETKASHSPSTRG